MHGEKLPTVIFYLCELMLDNVSTEGLNEYINFNQLLGLLQSTIVRVENGADTNIDIISNISNAFGKSLQINFA